MIKTRNEIRKIVNDLGYKFLDEYVGYDNNRKVIIQDDFGYKYDVVLFKLMSKNNGISFVAKGNPFSLPNISMWLKQSNKNFELCDDNVYSGSNNDLSFYCYTCKENFYMSWRMIYSNRGCAVCSGRQVGTKTSLAYLRPDLIKEFLYSKNNKSAEDVTEFSHETVYWKCSDCGYKWWATIKNRTKINGSDCPRCANEQKESNIATQCKIYFEDNYNATPEHKLFKNPKTNCWLRCDIYIPNQNVFIEINGEQHYKFNLYFHKNKEDFENRQYLDQIKKEFCQNNGLYIEIDLRKIKTSEEAIQYIENILLNN